MTPVAMQDALSTRHTRRMCGAVLVVAFLVRLVFWQATPDREWPHSAAFKGDAVVWADYAKALTGGLPFELGLPLRPPGNAYLLAALGVEGRHDAWRAKPAWCFLGAFAVMLFFRAALAGFGLAIALLVALWSSFSTSLLVLSTSLNNETPYLVLVGGLVVLAPRLRAKPSATVLIAWGGLNALACLFRVEHLIFFAVGTTWAFFTAFRAAGARSRPRHLMKRSIVVTGAFLVVLLPWHLRAWRAIRAFNTEPVALGSAGEAAQRSVEAATRALRWTAEAEAERQRLPGFARRSAANFVAATVMHRGGRVVDAGDFEILDQAFGYRPQPLPALPFVALYGPLNFYLANHGGAPAGFDPQGLDRLPVLKGGIDRYPRALLGGLPPADLNFYYPPHVELVTDGYRLGWEEIRQNSRTAARRSLRRLDFLWQGAATGWTGYGLPWGLHGVRRAVDLVVPLGGPFAAWRLGLLLLCTAGLWHVWRKPAFMPWFVLLVTKLVATVAFFGYARHGAALVPVVALLAGCAITRLARLDRCSHKQLLVAAALAAILSLGTESIRWAFPPTLVLDAKQIKREDPFPLGRHVDRSLAASR